METMIVPPGREGSIEDALHRVGPRDALYLFDSDHRGALAAPRGHRAIGVVYRPRFERYGNYVPTVLTRRYDAMLFCDETRALRLLTPTT
jgi:erythromycin esterase